METRRFNLASGLIKKYISMCDDKDKRIQELESAIRKALYTIDDPFNLKDETILAILILETALDKTEDKESNDE